ncbi:mast cell carboxypeptidase A isoform X2 [Mastomys coucha]|uniref:mast cell carboxypeptidase A isoform X2 n=1 Tax=Mastomys coucha TaxID=35658 RepID=UPI001261BBDF|nr:mast cell carboxypeptidase A isoform X2 [Mastomys coucha]
MKFFLLMSVIYTTLAIAPVHFDREKVFRVKLQDEKQASILKDLTQTIELDFWYPDASHDIAVNMTVDFRVSEKESQTIQSTLEQHKIHYEILIHDLQEEIEKQFDVKDEIAGRHSYAKYNDWDKIVSWTEKMLEKHPEMISRIKIGSTVEDNPLYVLKIGKKDGERKAIFMDCGIHAREWVSPAFCQWFVYQDRMWRKNRSKNRNSTCIGTDLNRNFDVSWDTSPNTDNPCHNVYRGPAPESEKETKAVTNFIRSHLNSIKAYITFHSYSQMLLIPYGYTLKPAPTHQDLLKVARIATDVLSTRYETRYIYGPIASTIYKTSGSSLDWVYDLGIKHTFAFELRDKGKFGFLLPESRIKPTCKETMLSVKFIAKYILKHTS